VRYKTLVGIQIYQTRLNCREQAVTLRTPVRGILSELEILSQLLDSEPERVQNAPAV